MSFTYQILRPFLHRLDPEKAHGLAVTALANHMLPSGPAESYPSLNQELFGLSFPNPVGLAAGFDKNAEAIAGLSKQGFGFIEVGTVTPQPQAGNPKPRLFRLKEDQAIINRLGFNNEGADAMLARMKKYHRPVVVGVNIGRNKDCEDAVSDYQLLVTKMAEVADYITINISSPNTQGLRNMQQKTQLEDLLSAIMEARNNPRDAHHKKPPLMLKISPDIDAGTQEDIAQLALSYQLDALIISNTTITRPITLKDRSHHEVGGLSGKPLMARSTQLLGRMYQLTKGQLPLVGVGGISSADEAYEKILAGASLVQLYTALVYQGFSLIPSINRGLVERLNRDGYAHIRQAIGKAH